MITLEDSEYEALLGWARLGAENAEQAIPFVLMRKAIDQRNKIKRYTLLIRIDTLPQRQMPSSQSGSIIQGETFVLEQTRPPTREDVVQALQGQAYVPQNVFVTRDPEGVVGWYQLDSFRW